MTNKISVYFKEENLTDLGHYKRLTTSCRCLSIFCLSVCLSIFSKSKRPFEKQTTPRLVTY